MGSSTGNGIVILRINYAVYYLPLSTFFGEMVATWTKRASQSGGDTQLHVRLPRNQQQSVALSYELA